MRGRLDFHKVGCVFPWLCSVVDFLLCFPVVMWVKSRIDFIEKGNLSFILNFNFSFEKKRKIRREAVKNNIYF